MKKNMQYGYKKEVDLSFVEAEKKVQKKRSRKNLMLILKIISFLVLVMLPQRTRFFRSTKKLDFYFLAMLLYLKIVAKFLFPQFCHQLQ
jgi:hypothetical protein